MRWRVCFFFVRRMVGGNVHGSGVVPVAGDDSVLPKEIHKTDSRHGRPNNRAGMSFHQLRNAISSIVLQLRHRHRYVYHKINYTTQNIVPIL